MGDNSRVSSATRRTFLKTSGAAAALTSVAGCSALGGGGSETISFGYSASLSGSTAVLGEPYDFGFKQWRDHVNENGGILGNEVELVSYDDESSPDRARELANRLASEDEVDFLFGPYGSPLNFSASVVSQQSQIPMVSGAASDPEIFDRGLNYYYSILSKTTEYGKSFPNWLESVDWGSVETDQPETVAQIRADAAFTSTLGEAYASTFEERDQFEVVYEEEYPLDQQDFSGIISEIGNQGPDILCLTGFPADEARFGQQAQQADLNVDIHYQNYSSQSVILDALGEQVDYMYNGAWWDYRYEYEGVDTYVPMWDEENDSPAPMPFGYATSAGMVYESAIEEAGSTDPDDVNAALAEVTPEVPVGPIDFHETGWNTNQYNNEAVRQWQDQTMELLYPDEFATSEAWLPTPDWGNRDQSP